MTSTIFGASSISHYFFQNPSSEQPSSSSYLTSFNGMGTDLWNKPAPGERSTQLHVICHWHYVCQEASQLEISRASTKSRLASAARHTTCITTTTRNGFGSVICSHLKFWSSQHGILDHHQLSRLPDVSHCDTNAQETC